MAHKLIKSGHGESMRVTSNKRTRVYTIDSDGTRYKSGPMSKQEFEDAEYNTYQDWINEIRNSGNFYL